VIGVFGREVLDLLFGKQYVHDGHTVAVLSCATLVGIVGLATTDGLWALDRPRLSSLTSLLGLTVLLVSSWFLVGRYGVLGAAYSTLFGMSAAAAVRSACFFHLTRTPKPVGELT
jgi:O-antigen/teichoic acid export membrane protein